MKVLVIGSGGREHALLWKLAQSREVTSVYAIPGNDGMRDVASIIPLKGTDDILDFARLMDVDLTVAGPETVLAEGLGDAFEERHMPFFGPSKAAARIEGSKGFAKDLMKKYGIPTARYEKFSDEEEAVSYIRQQKEFPLVIKADGLAAGKGVIIARDEKTAEEAARGMLEGKRFGEAGASIVIEEFMKGEEASVLAFCDGKTVVPMMPSQDHKQIGDGDKGPNTGGMGAYAPAPVIDNAMSDRIYREILKPVADAMRKEGYPFKGCLYAGLMITDEGPKVVEFNCRFGDPETEVVLPMLKSDLFKIMMDCVNGTLTPDEVEWNDGYCCDVVMASSGYPSVHSSGEVISGLKEAEKEGCLIFHAGTKRRNGKFVVNGGRVLDVVARGDTLQEARDKAYRGVSKIHWDGVQYRHDIAEKGLRHLQQMKK